MNSRNQSLDVLRGIAILLVLGRHYPYIAAWTRIGWSGVDLFFVLSGFLISRLLFREYQSGGGIDIKRFWIRRGLKIYPPFYALILVTILYWLIRYHQLPSAILGDVLFVQNYFPHVWSHGWSLAVEEHFYFLLPLILLLMVYCSRDKVNPFRMIPSISIALTVVCLCLRIHSVNTGGIWDDFFRTHLRIDALFVGVTLGYYSHFQPGSLSKRTLVPLWIVGVLLLLPGFLFGQTAFTCTAGFTFTFMGFACILVWAFNHEFSRKGPAPLLAWIGYYSYSIYLWHAVIFVAVFERIRPTPLIYSLYLFSSVLLGAGMATLIERPMLRLRNRYFEATRVPLIQQRPQARRAHGDTEILTADVP